MKKKRLNNKSIVVILNIFTAAIAFAAFGLSVYSLYLQTHKTYGLSSCVSELETKEDTVTINVMFKNTGNQHAAIINCDLELQYDDDIEGVAKYQNISYMLPNNTSSVIPPDEIITLNISGLSSVFDKEHRKGENYPLRTRSIGIKTERNYMPNPPGGSNLVLRVHHTGKDGKLIFTRFCFGAITEKEYENLSVLEHEDSIYATKFYDLPNKKKK